MPEDNKLAVASRTLADAAWALAYGHHATEPQNETVFAAARKVYAILDGERRDA